MRAQPFSACAFLPQDQRLVYECSDRILLPKAYCESFKFNANDLLELSNFFEEKRYGTLFETYTQEYTAVFMPSWMFFSLSQIEPISIGLCRKSRCTAIRLRPDSFTFQSRPDFLEILNSAIQSYSCLTKNTRIPLHVEDQMEFITIEGFLPSSESCAFVQNCGAIDVQVADARSVETPKSFIYKSNKETFYPFAFLGEAHRIGGDSPADLATAVATAARKRAGLKPSCHLPPAPSAPQIHGAPTPKPPAP